MSKISIKTDFADGEKLFAQQLNNNFLVIQAGINANEENLQQVIDQAIIELDNELEEITADRGWDWNGGDRVTFFKGTTSQVNTQEIKNGQMLYNIETGETALDDNGNRIVTGSGNVVTVSNNAPINPATKEWIKPITINGTDTAEEYFRDTNNNWKKILCEPSGDTLPIGAITQFSGEIAPTNWLFCNGQAISRTEYAELFSVIGTHYGEGDGSTTFNLPDFIGRVPVGLDAEDPDFDALGDFGGEKTHTLTIDEIPIHTHEEIAVANPASGGPGVRGTYNNQEGYGFTGYGTGVQSGISGGNEPHNIVQPYLVTNFIIKAKQSVGLVGVITNDIDDINVNAVPNAKTVKEKVEGDILYSDSTGTTGDITLSKNADNYSYKEIFFAKDGNENSVKISGNKASLIAHYTNSVNNTTYINFKNITISGTSLTVDSYQEWYNNWGTDGMTFSKINGISIIKVLGYK